MGKWKPDLISEKASVKSPRERVRKGEGFGSRYALHFIPICIAR